MATRLIGSGTTDSQGKININYTGTGAGKLQLIAKQGNLVSEPYVLIDGLFKDFGNTDWTSISNITRTTSSGEITLTPTDTFCTQYQTIPEDGTVFEFDVCITYSEATNFISFRSGSTNKVAFTQGNLGLSTGVWSHVKLVIDGETVTPTVDGVEKTSKTWDSTVTRFYFVLDNNKNTNLKYKNFVIYL